MKTALTLAAALLAACSAPKPPDSHATASHGFDASSPLPRLKTIPPWLLAGWAGEDGMPYEAYAASEAEKKILADAFAGRPAPMRKVLDERLLAVYLVKGLKGNGATTWVVDPSSRTFVYMLLNPAGFQQTVSEVMTERDRTLFKGPADLQVEAGALKGIRYTVAHESAHAYDYVHSVTPYADANYLPEGKDGWTAGWDVWAEYAKPRPAADYPLRTKLRFYGFGEPELEPAPASALCAQWAKSPFASIYGSRSWAEDFAELFVLRHLTQDLGQPLRRICGGKAYSPWDHPKVRARAQKLVEPLYADRTGKLL